jgi:hypothetical protein
LVSIVTRVPIVVKGVTSMEISEFRSRLAEAIDRRGVCTWLSKETGLSRQGIVKIATGEVSNPGILTVKSLEEAMGRMPRAYPDYSDRNVAGGPDAPGSPAVGCDEEAV